MDYYAMVCDDKWKFKVLDTKNNTMTLFSHFEDAKRLANKYKYGSIIIHNNNVIYDRNAHVIRLVFFNQSVPQYISINKSEAISKDILFKKIKKYLDGLGTIYFNEILAGGFTDTKVVWNKALLIDNKYQYFKLYQGFTFHNNTVLSYRIDDRVFTSRCESIESLLKIVKKNDKNCIGISINDTVYFFGKKWTDE